MLLCGVFLFFFKQKTAYEMRISDWSSDVCSSDLSVGEWLDAEEVVLEKSEARNGSDPRADGPVGYANRIAFDSAPVGSAECRFLVEQVDDGNFTQVEVAFDVLAEADAAIVRFVDDPLEFNQKVASAALDEIAGSQMLVRLGRSD